MKRWAPIIALLLIATPAAAQEVTLTVENTPSEPSVEAGESLDLGGDVTIQVSGVDCGAEVPLPVNLTASPSAPAGQDVSAEQGAISFALPAGVYHSEANGTEAGPYTSTNSGSATVSPASGVSEEYTMDVELVAVFAGASSMECIPNEIPGAESTPVTVSLTVMPDQSAPAQGSANDSGGMDGGGDQFAGDRSANDTRARPGGSGDDGDNGDNGVPIPWQIAPLALALTAFTLRRRDT